MRFTYAAALILAFTLLLTPGCSKRTPEDRMRKAVQLAQQRDTLGAMLEAKDLIKKHPDDPMALQARMLLAQIAANDRRIDDALAEYKAVLDTVSQKDPLGVAALRSTIALLRQSKRTDEALKTIDEYQKRYADDEGVSLSLTVARAEVLATDGQTTDARTILLGLRETTTQPEILRFYRSMIASTYMRDKAFADALAFFTAELQRADNEADKRSLMLQIAGTHAAMENYDEARKILSEATQQYDSAIRRELDAQERLALASELVNAYSGIGNLPGVKTVVEGLIAQTDDARLAASILLERGARAALITLGAQGCLYVAADQEAHVPAPTVTAVDTTGAGDAFVGSLAHFLGAGLPALEAIARANAIAAISVQHPGTQASYPRWADLPENLR
jgi:tetratricopeptide (TPR) repeat protein